MGLRSSFAVAVVCRLAAVALIRPLAWELPYVTKVVLKSKKKERREGRNKKKEKRKEGRKKERKKETLSSGQLIFQQTCQRNSVRKRQAFQQMVLEQLHIYLQK